MGVRNGPPMGQAKEGAQERHVDRGSVGNATGPYTRKARLGARLDFESPALLEGTVCGEASAKVGRGEASSMASNQWASFWFCARGGNKAPRRPQGHQTKGNAVVAGGWGALGEEVHVRY